MAIVQLEAEVEGAGDIVLRNYADPASPRTACSFAAGNHRVVQLIDARHVVIEHDFRYFAVVDLPDVRFHWFELPPDQEASPTFLAVSPGLDQVLWMSTHVDTETSATDEVHITTSAGDHVVASWQRPLGGRCGDPDDSNPGAYTHSGAHAFVLSQVIRPQNRLLVIEGETAVLSVLPPSEGWQAGSHPAMAVWSPTSETLYYRQGSDVWQRTAGSDPEPFLEGVIWSHPTITPDGNYLAYAVAREDGLHDVYLVDLAHDGSPQRIGESRNQPVFLNSTQLWYRTEGQGMCGPSGDEPRIYDVTDSMEFPSTISRVVAVWPATSSNH